MTGNEYPSTTDRPAKQPESTETFDIGTSVDADVGTIYTGSPEVLDASNENEIPTDIDEVKYSDAEFFK